MRKEEMRSKLKTVSLKTWLEILLPPAFTFLVNSLVYWGAPLLRTGIPVHNLSGRLDELVPFLPPFIIVYFGCYAFWVVNYLIIAVQEKEHRYRFFTADLYSRLICFVCFGAAGSYGMDFSHTLEMDVIMGLMTALAIYRHRANISRLLNGTENKLGAGKAAQK